METQKSDSRITPANWIATIAMALLALFTFFGLLYSSGDGQIGMALLLTALQVVLLTCALVVAIKAKQKTSYFRLWRIVMYVALAVYVVVALVFAPPLLNFFRINAEKDNLKDMAKQEIESIEQLYNDYDNTMQTATNEAVERIQQYMRGVKNNAIKSPSMENLLSEWEINSVSDLVGNDENSGGWKREIEDKWTLSEDNDLNEWKLVVDQWGFFDTEIAQVAAVINQKADDVVQLLNKSVDENKKVGIIPIIEINSSNQYEYTGLVEKTFELPNVGGFHKAMSEGNTKSVLGWILFLLIHLLILLNYIVTKGTDTILRGTQHNNKIGYEL